MIKWEGKGFNKNIKIYELKNGKGIIKEYDNDGNIIFKGQYLKGIRNGEGIEYDNNKNIIFEGFYKNGQMFVRIHSHTNLNLNPLNKK